MKLFAAGQEVPYASRSNEMERIVGRGLEARVGFEPTNGGFADLSLGPLGYRAKRVSIAKFLLRPGHRAPMTLELQFIFLCLPPAG
jgi:hypothetical protein